MSRLFPGVQGLQKGLGVYVHLEYDYLLRQWSITDSTEKG